MTGMRTDWHELERLWQSAEIAAPAIDIVARQRRRIWVSRLVVGSEVVAVVAGLAGSVLIISSDRTFAPLIGGAALLLTVFAGAASLWARTLPAPAMDGSVLGALDAAIHRSRVGVRWALASLWVVVACLVYLAIVAVAFAAAAGASEDETRQLLHMLAFGTIWAAGGQVVAIVYYLRRSRELARLEDVKRSLAVD